MTWIAHSPTGGVTHIRPREANDLTTLTWLLAEQQPFSNYPNRWPLPMPVEQFIVREHEEAAWVAVTNGVVAGHVSVQTLDGDDLSDAYVAGTGRPASELRLVSALFTAQLVRGRGVGSALLRHASEHILARGLRPVLDVAQANEDAIALYRAKGWREIGRARPSWLLDDEPDVLLMTFDAPERSAGHKDDDDAQRVEDLEFLEALRVAVENPREIFHLIVSEPQDAQELQAAIEHKFGFSPAQAQAVLDLQVRRFTRTSRDQVVQDEVQLRAGMSPN